MPGPRHSKVGYGTEHNPQVAARPQMPRHHPAAARRPVRAFVGVANEQKARDTQHHGPMCISLIVQVKLQLQIQRVLMHPIITVVAISFGITGDRSLRGRWH